MKLNIKHLACAGAAVGAIALGIFGALPAAATETQGARIALFERDLRPAGADAAGDSGRAARCVCRPGKPCPLCAPTPKPPPLPIPPPMPVP